MERIVAWEAFWQIRGEWAVDEDPVRVHPPHNQAPLVERPMVHIESAGWYGMRSHGHYVKVHTSIHLALDALCRGAGAGWKRTDLIGFVIGSDFPGRLRPKGQAPRFR